VALGGTYDGYRCNGFYTRGDNNADRYHLLLNSSTGATRAYVASCAASTVERVEGTAIIGCSFGASTNESIIRLAGSHYFISVAYCDLDATNVPSKHTIRLVANVGNGYSSGNNRYAYLWRNKESKGGCTVGSNTTSRMADGFEVARVEACLMNGSQSGGNCFGPSGPVDRVALVSSILLPDVATKGGIGISQVGNTWDTVGKLRILCNTIYAQAGVTRGPITGGDAYASGWHAKGNVFSHANPADNTDYIWSVYSAAFTDIDDNVCLTVSDFTNLLAFYEKLEGGTGNLASWNGLANVGTDAEKAFTLDADYLPSSTHSIVRPAGVYDDYYGTAKSATCVAGAVESAP